MSNTLTAEVVHTAELAVGATLQPEKPPITAPNGTVPAPNGSAPAPNGTAPVAVVPAAAQSATASAGAGPPHANGYAKPLVAKRVLTGVPSGHAATLAGTAPTASRPIPPPIPVPPPIPAPPVPASTSAIVGVATLVAEPVYDDPATSDPAADGTFDQVVDGIRLGLRRLATATGLSALVHCVLLTLLGLFTAAGIVSKRPYLASDVAQKPPLILEVISPKAEKPPVVAKVDMTPKTAGDTAGNKAYGVGSAGLRGGAGGGQTGGMVVPGVKIDPLKQVASGGRGGLGTDRAYGSDLMGEAGEAVPSGATFFGVKAEGKSFAFVVDTSGSMSANMRYMRCREELLRSVAALHYRQKYFITFFNHTLFPMPERQLVEAKPNQVRQTMAWITGAVPTGFTEPWPGLLMAIRMKPDAIYLLTDGEFDTGVIEKVIAAQPQSKKIPIHTIAFESQAGEPTLQTISRLTGGTYRYVP